MAEPLKNMYSPFFFEKLCPILNETIPGFHCNRFIHCVFDSHWPDLELKQRVRQITNVLHHFLPPHFPEAVKILITLSKRLRTEFRGQGFALIFLADYIEVYGLDHYDQSVQAMEEITQLVSAEFAVRPFLIRYPEKMMQQMRAWAAHEADSVRRLASEGCRPRLPWAIQVPFLKQDPSTILPILETLKQDPSDYVRRSVANNLNDIAKDHPEVVLRLVSSWKGNHPYTDWIIRHGCRTLLKRGNKDALVLHGFRMSKALVTALALRSKRVKIGDALHFSFVFTNQEKHETLFRLEYAIDYVTSTGKTSRKIFKIKEGTFSAFEKTKIDRKQSFTNFTTRKHYKGKHRLQILVNGKLCAATEFMVH